TVAGGPAGTARAPTRRARAGRAGRGRGGGPGERADRSVRDRGLRLRAGPGGADLRRTHHGPVLAAGADPRRAGLPGGRGLVAVGPDRLPHSGAGGRGRAQRRRGHPGGADRPAAGRTAPAELPPATAVAAAGAATGGRSGGRDLVRAAAG